MTPRMRSVVLPLALVVIVVVASLLATGSQTPRAVETSSGTAVTLSRTLSCIPDTRPAAASSVRIGTVPAGAPGESLALAKAGRVVFAPQAAASGYGVQWASTKRWLAARSCPSPGDDWWFTGAGAGITHRSILTLDNPRANDANVTIAVYGPHGQVDAPGLSGLLVPAGQSLRIDLEAVAPALGDLSVHVSAVRGLVAASMWEQWAQSAVSKSVWSWVPAAPQPAARVGLIGVPGKLSHATLVVTNPSSSSAVVSLKVVTSAATFTPTKHQTFTLPPDSTTAVGLDDLLKVGFGGLELSSSRPITAGLRAVRGNLESYAAAADRIGAESTLGLPGGVPATLTLAAPAASSATVQVIDTHGRVVLQKTLTLPRAQTMSIPLPKTAVALSVTSDRRSGIVGAVILDDGRVAVLGLVPTANAARVPPVIARPY